MSSRRELQAQIDHEERRLADLEAKAEAARVRLATLREQVTAEPTLPAIADPGSTVGSHEAPTTNAGKVALFRSLFRGREDVFARRWENVRKGMAGYSPACSNEWQHGLCEKTKGRDAPRRVTCAECPNQAFTSVSDAEVAKHLRGEQVIGVYPLLRDETCWLLAADFDKTGWQEDVRAFAATCAAYDVPVAVERSRSGEGAHAWLFFSAPVAANVARRLGCLLITETMAQRHQLPMRSYDRLFPNQDTMPKGGFGNLIALPLQRQAREAGNSVFVDSGFVPWPDQWAFMAGVRRIDPASAQALADEASRSGRVMGMRASDSEDETDRAPWTRRPSGAETRIVIREPLPSTVKGVLSQRLFIEKAGLPSPLLNRLKRLAAFQNPEYYKKQSMRLSTALTPRVISCAEEFPEHIALPRGCLYEAQSVLSDHGVSLSIEDKREKGKTVSFAFQGTLTSLQEKATQSLLSHDTGVLVAPPGFGKTVVGAHLVAARRVNTLVLVHRKPLLDQWVAQLAVFLGLEPKQIGQIGAGTHKPNERLDVAMVQSLVRKGSVSDLVAHYGQVILDEGHHCPAASFERVLAEAKAKYVVGLTATPRRRDGHDPILHMQLGPIRFAVDAKDHAGRRPFEHKVIVRETGFSASGLPEGAGIQELYAAIAADQDRNALIAGDVLGALEEKRSPIVLTERRDHLEHLAAQLRGVTRHLFVLHGGMKAKERREMVARLAAVPDGTERLLLATGRYIGEGFDDARLDTLFLALPVSWKGTLIQYTGRLHRTHPGKLEVRIYDYVDRDVPMLARMFEKRLRGYRAIDYTCD